MPEISIRKTRQSRAGRPIPRPTDGGAKTASARLTAGRLYGSVGVRTETIATAASLLKNRGSDSHSYRHARGDKNAWRMTDRRRAAAAAQSPPRIDGPGVVGTMSQARSSPHPSALFRPCCDRPSASPPVPCRQRAPAATDAVLTGRNGPGRAWTVANRAGIGLTDAVRTGLQGGGHETMQVFLDSPRIVSAPSDPPGNGAIVAALTCVDWSSSGIDRCWVTGPRSHEPCADREAKSRADAVIRNPSSSHAMSLLT